MPKNHTIRDVAREAGVSVATVSRVLNNKPDTSPEARRKVEVAIGTLGYSRSSQWQQLTTGKASAISLLFPDTQSARSHINLDFVTAVATACEERDYRLDLITRPMSESDLLDLYRSNKSDGTILMKVGLSDWRADLLRDSKLPFVMIGHTDEPVGASYVDYDFEAAIRLGVQHLHALGHRHIGYVSPAPPGEVRHGPTVRARRGYEAVCADLDLPALRCDTDHELGHVRLMTANLLAEHPEVTALVATRELLETAVFSAVHETGRRIPDDISVLGLTTPDGPELTSPALTGLEFPAWAMAYEAGRILIDQLEGTDQSLKEILWDPRINVRGSTGPVSKRPDQQQPDT